MQSKLGVASVIPSEKAFLEYFDFPLRQRPARTHFHSDILSCVQTRIWAEDMGDMEKASIYEDL